MLSIQKAQPCATKNLSSFRSNFRIFPQVLLYATALREAIDEQGLEAKSNGELIVKKMWQRTILGRIKHCQGPRINVKFTHVRCGPILPYLAQNIELTLFYVVTEAPFYIFFCSCVYFCPYLSRLFVVFLFGQ